MIKNDLKQQNISNGAVGVQKVEANCIAEVAFVSDKDYKNPFMELELDAIVTTPDGTQIRTPMYWAGGKRWCLRYASSFVGVHSFCTECSDKSNKKLHGVGGTIEVTAYKGENALYRHGPLKIDAGKRYFEHADGTPFLWLGDTWWKNLSKRLSFDDFRKLAKDRKTKGFNVVQIICGAYPDENMFESSWENEGGKPYETRDFSVVNPAYFDHADRRFKCLADTGLVPAIVGGWGRPQSGGRSTIAQIGVDGYKRHWRNLIARYGAYPTVWIVGGETNDAQGPWSEIAAYVKSTDPFGHLLVYHSPGHPRQMLKDNSMFDFDMAAIGHDGNKAAEETLSVLKSCYCQVPTRPVICGEACYEGHMQKNPPDLQRRLFWSFILSGAAGHTYGAAGIYEASIEGDPGMSPVFDITTWQDGMVFPGAAQLGLGWKLLEQYPWEKFEPHPDWVDDRAFASGIPGENRLVYLPVRGTYDWAGITVYGLERDQLYHSYLVDPIKGKTFDRDTVVNAGSFDLFLSKEKNNIIFHDQLNKPESGNWEDIKTEISFPDSHSALMTGKISVLQEEVVPPSGDYMVSVEAAGNGDSGIVVDYIDNKSPFNPLNYILALYSPSSKQIRFYGKTWGILEGAGTVVDVPDLGENIKLVMLVRSERMSFMVTDGTRSYGTSISLWSPGKIGLWQPDTEVCPEYTNFIVSGLPRELTESRTHVVFDSLPYNTGKLPSCQDWVLVLEKIDSED